jgi:hypothetical protein
MSRSLLRGILVYESAESVEHKVLDHHLEDKDLGAVGFECVPIVSRSIYQCTHLQQNGIKRKE